MYSKNRGRSLHLRIFYIWPHPYQPTPHELPKHKTIDPYSLTDPDWGSRRWWSCPVCLHCSAISWSGPGPRWCEDKQITQAVSIRIHAEKSWQTALIRHDTAQSYAVRKEADGARSGRGGGTVGPDEKMAVIVTDWLRSEVGRMPVTRDSAQQRWCNTLPERAIPLVSCQDGAGWLPMARGFGGVSSKRGGLLMINRLLTH